MKLGSVAKKDVYRDPGFSAQEVHDDSKEETRCTAEIPEAKEKLRQHGLKATMLRQAKGIMAVLKWFDADIR